MATSKVIDELTKLHDAFVLHDGDFKRICKKLHPDYQISAINLCRYLLLRSTDLRRVHDELSEIGISSLRSPESYVFRNVADALKLLHLLDGKAWHFDPHIEAIGYREGNRLLKMHSRALFGKKKERKSPHIMITMPTEAASDFALVKNLVASGMTIARINLGHDKLDIWRKMVKNVIKAAKQAKTKCKIYIDLAGPKIRTGQIKALSSSKKKKKKKEQKAFIPLKTGDELFLHKSALKGYPATRDQKGHVIKPAGISVTLPGIIDDAKIKDRLYFDDGKIACRVMAKSEHGLTLKVIRASAKGAKLKAEKGINLPDTILRTPSLTKSDIKNLDFVAACADIVGYSFVRTPEDIRLLYKELEKRKTKDLGLVLKIENQEAFTNLPILLIEAMKKAPVGIMIARGDLAVELGLERVSEAQEQILWFCEASHIPVIWATQILENMAKNGIATRAEITDAAMSVRAECVMLNKGPYINEATKLLSRILQLMEKHQTKKKTRLRALHIAVDSLKKLKVSK